jgi:hypothetical protein
LVDKFLLNEEFQELDFLEEVLVWVDDEVKALRTELSFGDSFLDIL